MEYILLSSIYRQQQQFLKCFAGSLVEWGSDAGFSVCITQHALFRNVDAPLMFTQTYYVVSAAGHHSSR